MGADFLRRKQSGVYVINPDLVFKGTRQARLNVLNEYHQAEYAPLSDTEKLANLNESIKELQKKAEELSKKIESSHTEKAG